jgi:hypothetical protein
MGYTAQFGNGFSATIAAEAPRKTQIVSVHEGDFDFPIFDNSSGTPGGFVGNTGWGNYGGFQAPDVVMNLRVDQAWGSAQIMGALHEVNALYYFAPSGDFGASLNPGAGHPDDKLGFAVGAGLKLNAPFIGQGDYFQSQVNYTQGALRYIFQTPNSNWGKIDGDSAGFGIMSDAVMGGSLFAGGDHAATDLELTTAWNVNAAYEHFWNPRWRTSLYGGYAEVSYNDRANALLCTGETTNENPGCDNNWKTWWIGTRTQWNVTKDFYMGLDVLYSKLQTATFGVNGVCPGATTECVNAGFNNPWRSRIADDVDNWSFRFRVHRDFYP